VVLDSSVVNPEMASFYNVDNSDTAKPILTTDDGVQTVRVDMGSYSVNGEKYTDKLCLIQNTNKRTDKSGRLCVFKMNLIVGKTLYGELDSSGIVGLAPGHGKTSIVQ